MPTPGSTTAARRGSRLAVAVLGVAVLALVIVLAAFALSGGGPQGESSGPAWTELPSPSESGASAGDDDEAGPSGRPSASATPSSSAGAVDGEPCRAQDVELRVEVAGGRGRTIVAENAGRRPCALEGFPELALLDAQGRELDVAIDERGAPREVLLDSGERAEAELTWTGGGQGATSASVELAIAAGEPSEEVRARIPAGRGARLELGPWR